jgi:hypothetical protein
MSIRGLVATLGAFAVVACGATGAAADGGPSPGVMTGDTGVIASGGKVRYVTLSDGRRTVVEAVATRNGIVRRFLWLRGNYGIPVVAYDGTAEGVSLDGRTLVLAPWLGPQPARTTKFAIVDARTLRLRRIVTLRGVFSYDALSPDGKTLYVIQYLSDALRYVVRAYDLATRHLLPGAIADRREEGAMAGSPVTRETSAGRGWAYTLYARQPGRPFVHALDTEHRQAVCIDLPWRSTDQAVWSVRMTLSRDGRRLVLSQKGVGRLAVVDTRTFAVRAFRRPHAPRG